MQITNDRLKHSLTVATKMKLLATTDKYQVDPDEAFILGMLHDIGYEFCVDAQDHAHKGGDALKKQGYKFWREVYYHGVAESKYNSSMLKLLNYADITTGPAGENMTMQERLDDIAIRYGQGSPQEVNAIKLVKQFIKEKE